MSPDTVPAYTLWVELATRVTTQTLHYRMGDEETAARSIHKLFGKTRELLEKHPEAAAFRSEALTLLNIVLRPYTARWHGWMAEDKSRKDSEGQAALVFRDELVRRMFRAELRELQPELVRYKARLAKLAAISDPQETAKDSTASLGDPIKAGIGRQIDIASSPSCDGSSMPEKINAAEHAEILKRRQILADKKNARTGPDKRDRSRAVRRWHSFGDLLSRHRTGDGARKAVRAIRLSVDGIRRRISRHLSQLRAWHQPARKKKAPPANPTQPP